MVKKLCLESEIDSGTADLVFPVFILFTKDTDELL